MNPITPDTGSRLIKTRILQCALDLIKKDGYNKVTIPLICKAAGITKSVFYYHYSSKDDLLSDFADQLASIAEKSYSKILLQETYLRQIWTIFHLLLEGHITAGPAIVKQVFISYLNVVNHPSFPCSETSWDILVKLLEKAQEDGQIKNDNPPEKIAKAAFELLRGILVTWAIEDGGFDLEETSKILLTTLLSPAEGYDF